MPEVGFTDWQRAPVSDAEIERTAHLWLERYGAGAVAVARARAAELRHKGDISGADAWLRLIVAVEERTQGRRS